MITIKGFTGIEGKLNLKDLRLVIKNGQAQLFIADKNGDVVDDGQILTITPNKLEVFWTSSVVAEYGTAVTVKGY